MNNLTIDDFEKWLKNVPLNTCVGYPRNACKCPIAEFLTVHLNAVNNVSVSVGSYTVFGSDTKAKKLPRWADVFIIAVDQYPRRGIDYITADLALNLLRRIRALYCATEEYQQ